VEARRRAPRQARDDDPRRIARGKEAGEAGDVKEAKEAKEAKELEEVAAPSPDRAAVCKLDTPRGEGFLYRVEKIMLLTGKGLRRILFSRCTY
jgi:hypothetical protein